jgi:hypothetical protein
MIFTQDHFELVFILNFIIGFKVVIKLDLLLHFIKSTKQVLLLEEGTEQNFHYINNFSYHLAQIPSLIFGLTIN